jgi:hypothetical protein
MPNKPRLILTTLTTTILMACCITTTSANRLSISNKNFRITWAGFVVTAEAGEGLITCPVTLEGSFHSATIRKVEGALIGHVSRASVTSTSCRGGGMTINQASLPWHVTYEGFMGRLPRIERQILLFTGVNFALELNSLGVRCGYGRPEDNLKASAILEGGGAITTLTPEAGMRLHKLSGGILCPETAGVTGEGQVTLLGNTAKLTIRLI